MNVKQLVVNPENNGFVCLLTDRDEERVLPVGVGSFEAQAIALKLGRDRPMPRPLTHDLMVSAIDRMGSRVERVNIVDLRDNEFFAHVLLKREGEEQEAVKVNARPSDAIALALRTESDIFVSEDVMERGGIEADAIQESGGAADPRLQALRDRMGEAVREEDYEKAARLRDRIQEVQSEIRRRAEAMDDVDEDLGERLTRDFGDSPGGTSPAGE